MAVRRVALSVVPKADLLDKKWRAGWWAAQLVVRKVGSKVDQRADLSAAPKVAYSVGPKADSTAVHWVHQLVDRKVDLSVDQKADLWVCQMVAQKAEQWVVQWADQRAAQKAENWADSSVGL